MIYGIGLDITELKRIASMAGRQKRFAERILTQSELDHYQELSEKEKSNFSRADLRQKKHSRKHMAPV